MSASRVIRVFPDDGAGPLWERSHPKYAMEAADDDSFPSIATGTR